jgi:hypothetical protein
MEMHPVFQFLDPYLIWWFRLTGVAAVDFLLGTFAVAVLALLVGKAGSALAFAGVRRYFERLGGEAGKYHELSLEALKAGDRPAYEAANRLANESFSKSFFLQLALSAAFFWPIAFMLAWMQYRFLGLEFPVPYVGFSLGFIGVFIISYAAAYFLFKLIKHKPPFNLFLSKQCNVKIN